MVLQDSEYPAELKYVELLLLIAAFLFTSPYLFLTSPYQSIWYRCVAVIWFAPLCVAGIYPAYAVIDGFLSLSGTTLGILFIVLVSFRYVRLVVNIVAFFLYRPIAVSEGLTADDVTVIIPSLEAEGEEFDECIESISAGE